MLFLLNFAYIFVESVTSKKLHSHKIQPPIVIPLSSSFLFFSFFLL